MSKKHISPRPKRLAFQNRSPIPLADTYLYGKKRAFPINAVYGYILSKSWGQAQEDTDPHTSTQEASDKPIA
jgi:hypothetical protein